MSNPGQSMTPSGVMSGIGATFNAFSDVMAADMKADQKEYELTQQRKDLEVQAEADRVQARQQQQKINEQLDDAMAQQKAIQGASNVAMGSGSPARTRTQTVESAQDAKQRIASNFRLNRIERQSRIDQLKINEEYVPEMIEKQGTAQALSGLSQWGMRMGMKKAAQSQRYKNQKDVPSERGHFDQYRQRNGYQEQSYKPYEQGYGDMAMNYAEDAGSSLYRYGSQAGSAIADEGAEFLSYMMGSGGQ